MNMIVWYDFESSFAWLLERIANLKVYRDQKIETIFLMGFNQNDRNIYEQLLFAFEETINTRKQQLLLGIKIILRDNCKDADQQTID